jgi:ribosomal-protein-alanine N-acetyltransferase
MNKIVIETPRLILREFLMEDAPFVFELNADREVIQYTGDTAFSNLSEAIALIQNYDQYKKHGYGRWTILRKEDFAYLGWCGLKYNADIKQTDLGFRLMKRYWGKGYATEAAQACLDYGFEHLDLAKIIGRAMIKNHSSIRVLTKIGMKFEKEFEAHGEKSVQCCITK